MSSEARPVEPHKSYEFIARFTALDNAPIVVVDDASQAARDAQIIKLTRVILGGTTHKATDAQVLKLYDDYLAGRY